MIRSWTEAELSGDTIGRQGEDVLGAMTAAMTRNIRPPRRPEARPDQSPALALMMMVERLNYYATTSQVVATRDELLDTLVEVISSALFA